MANDKVIREKTIPATEATMLTQGIRTIKVNHGNSLIVHYSNGEMVNGIFVPDDILQRIVIQGHAYDELMSDKPSWNNKKDAGLFNFDDVWYVIGLIENGTLTSELGDQ
jgi:hypothetical protein